MSAELIARYDGVRVPRYTSYPTAPHFGPDVDAARYLGWLGELAPGTTASLYLHVPFCESMCWYCGCHTKVVARYEPIAAYVSQLEREIALIAAALSGPLTVGHIHWGGGTPTMLRPDDFNRLMERLRAAFTVAADAEIAIEIDPRTLSTEMVAALAAAGVNRASLGVQDFDSGVQSRVNRVQPHDVTASTLTRLRAAGIGAINFDLMYGLPGQTVESCRASAHAATALAPDRFAVFGYAHVPWMKRHQKMMDEAALPDAGERWRQYLAIADALTTAGLVAIGLDHFAQSQDPLTQALRAGRLRRNFQGYTTDEASVLIGFGASAIGFLPQGYIQNHTGYHEYEAAIASSRPATARGRVITDEDRARRAVIERLMCDLRVDLAAIGAEFGLAANAFDDAHESLADLVAQEIAEFDGRTVAVPERARPLVRIVAASFDRYLKTGIARHSAAV